MTLTNAFYFEDTFNESDIASGINNGPSHSPPPLLSVDDDDDLTHARVRRAFYMMEKVCATEDARRSLQCFRSEYVARFGSRWLW